jgi:hypothetical protein
LKNVCVLCALVFVSCPPLSLLPNFYEHHLWVSNPFILGVCLFSPSSHKRFWIIPKALNFKLFSMMFNGMLHLSTSGIFNMVLKQLRNVSTQKKHGSKWVYFSKWWILFIKKPTNIRGLPIMYNKYNQLTNKLKFHYTRNIHIFIILIDWIAHKDNLGPKWTNVECCFVAKMHKAFISNGIGFNKDWNNPILFELQYWRSKIISKD